MSDAILSWRRLVEAEVRDHKLAVARARQAVTRAEQIETLLRGERARRDDAERERRGRGEMPTFAQERMNALLERALERAAAKVAAAHADEARAVEKLRDAWQRVTVLDRLLARRAERERLHERREEQKEHDEIAGRRAFMEAALTPVRIGSMPLTMPLTLPLTTNEELR
jgi:flagellar biosynthesis chaperone FliJ